MVGDSFTVRFFLFTFFFLSFVEGKERVSMVVMSSVVCG